MESSSIEHNGGHGPGFQPGTDPAVLARRRARLAIQGERNREALRGSDRARFRFAVMIALICVVECVIGFLPMAWALHTTDLENARIAWALGPPLGTGLVLGTLVLAGMKWDRQDW